MRRVEAVVLMALLAGCATPASTDTVPTSEASAVPLPSNPTPSAPPEQPDAGPVPIEGSDLDTDGIQLVDVTVIHVDDGDSLIVELDGREERVRLLGINAPERDECLGDVSRQALENLEGEVVALGLEAEPRDQFDRLLAHVFTEDGYVNLAQVQTGLAIVISGDHAFIDELTDAQDTAESAAAGLWSPDVCGGGPIPDLEITRIDENPPGPDEDALDLEIVEITNRSDQAADLSGFVLRDESTANRFVFPNGIILDAGDSLEVSAGCDPPRNALAWCADGPVWNNGGDTALLLDPAGRIVDHMGYRG
ncbi:MAG: lamin tail domain-containing protein [Acidimicrobiia bacterium]